MRGAWWVRQSAKCFQTWLAHPYRAFGDVIGAMVDGPCVGVAVGSPVVYFTNLVEPTLLAWCGMCGSAAAEEGGREGSPPTYAIGATVASGVEALPSNLRKIFSNPLRQGDCILGGWGGRAPPVPITLSSLPPCPCPCGVYGALVRRDAGPPGSSRYCGTSLRSAFAPFQQVFWLLLPLLLVATSPSSGVSPSPGVSPHSGRPGSVGPG